MFSHILAFVLGFIFCKYLKPLRQKAFARFMAFAAEGFTDEFNDFKRQTFKGLKEMKSHFPEMQQRNSIKILEIGVGSGANFQFYPEGCHLTVVDPNPNFKSYYDKNRAKYPQIKSEEIIVCGGEDMDRVPDASVDVVVVSWVFCSVEDADKVLQQILRVLVPGGKFFFVEHVREWDSEKNYSRAMRQTFLTKLRIWPNIFDGCELDRDTLSHIKKAGFSHVDGDLGYAPLNGKLFDNIKPHAVGVATK